MASKEQRLRLAFFAGCLAVATVGGWWLLVRPISLRPAGANPAARIEAPQPASEAVLPSVKINPALPPAARANLLTPKEGIAAALAALDKQYGYAGALSWEAGKALVAQREKAATNLVAELAKLGPGGAASMGAAYRQEDNLRDKALLVRALAMVNDDQAAATLQELLNSEPIYSLQRDIVTALSHRADSASTQVLGGVLNTSDNQQLRYLAAVALQGREDALPILEDHLGLETSLDVQQASMRSIAAIPTGVAQQALASLAQNGSTEQIRQMAVVQLARKSN